jgi:hypothetical protein
VRNAGGAALVASSSNVSISLAVFDRNTKGAAVCASKCTVSVDHTRFTANVDELGSAPSAGMNMFGGSAVLSFSIFDSHVSSLAGALFLGDGTVVDIESVTFNNNRAQSSGLGSGAIYVASASVLSADSMKIERNVASGTIAAGAVLVRASTVTITGSGLSHNSIAIVPGVEVAGASGSVYTLDGSRFSMTQSTLTRNEARDSATGEPLACGTCFQHFFASQPRSAFLRDVSITPYVSGVSFGMNPGVLNDVMQGSCQQYPCAPGFSCTFDNATTRCHSCSGVTCSPDGIQCQLCDPGSGPNDDQTGCVPCTGNNFSTFGVCLPCPSSLVVAPGKSECRDCGVHRTAITGTQPNTASECGCQDEYFNSSVRPHICFANGFDKVYKSVALRAREAQLDSTYQPCERCPTDVVGYPCLICSGGGEPTMAAGYTAMLPQLYGGTQSRRGLQAGTELTAVIVLRCHVDIDIARLRCPENPDFVGQCANGYRGRLCGECINGWGMNPQRVCEPCLDAGYTGKSVAILAVVISASLLVVGAVARTWKSCPLRHLPRCMFQPMRIIITYSQVRDA